MNYREEFFKSPHPRNLQYFNFPNDKIHHDGEQLFENHLFPDLARDPKSPFVFVQHPDSPFSYVTPNPLNTHRLQQGQRINNNFGMTPLSVKNEKPIYKPTQHIINQKINFSESEQDQFIETPCKVFSQQGNERNQTTATKKYDLRFAGSATSRKTTRQNQRGLRVLSKLAYQIVLESGPTTYKQVADKLISEQNEEEKMDDKQRQNIKRRVYDALNVLIALGQLDKKGRKIIKSKKRQKMEQEENKLIQNKSKLLSKLKKRKQGVIQKKQQKERILKLNKSLKKLMNINMNQRRQQNKQIDHKLVFPLIFMEKSIPKIQGLPSMCHFQPQNSEAIILRGQSDALTHLVFPQK